jgi:hypothetical protein
MADLVEAEPSAFWHRERYEYRLNECSKLATKDEKDGCTAGVQADRAMRRRDPFGQHDLYGLGFAVNLAFILLCGLVVGFLVFMFKWLPRMARWLVSLQDRNQ